MGTVIDPTTLNGNSGTDRLNGGAGNDLAKGGEGGLKDTAGSDIFRFFNAAEARGNHPRPLRASGRRQHAHRRLRGGGA